MPGRASSRCISAPDCWRSRVLGIWLIERYSRVTRGVRGLGHGLVALTVIGLCVAGRVLLPQVSSQFEWMLTAAFTVGEWLLAAMLVVWAVYVVVQTAALVLGLCLGSRSTAPPDGRSIRRAWPSSAPWPS